LVAAVYKDINRRVLSLPRFYEHSRKQWPGLETEKLNAPGVALSITNDSWHYQFLRD
jgi:hypothetical protein